MKKKEWLYRLMVYKSIEKKEKRFTQLGLSKALGISLSTINNALKPLEKIGAIEVKRMGFGIMDMKKLLAFWASARNLEKDVVYSTRANISIRELERSLPPKIIFTAYTAYKLKYSDVPADYSEIYVYADEKTLDEIKRRFPEAKGPPNLIVLASDLALADVSEKGIAPAGQIYCDLWNLREWYAHDFLKAMEGELGWQ